MSKLYELLCDAGRCARERKEAREANQQAAHAIVLDALHHALEGLEQAGLHTYASTVRAAIQQATGETE